MATYSYGQLAPSEEDALHQARLLQIEDKAFQRIKSRLLGPGSLVKTFPRSSLTPPPDASAADEAAAAVQSERQQQGEARRQWREGVLLDFASLESSIIRIQLLRRSNERERERYAAEKIKILETAQAVKDNTADLRVQLDEAQKTLLQRKAYDVQAEKITNNRMLRPREDQHAQLDKLNAEISELEKESRNYAQTWTQRREQFGKIVEEGQQMLKLIRDEKEEAERKEGMDDIGERDEDDSTAMKGETSQNGTPRPDMGGATPMHVGQNSDDPTPPKGRPLPISRLLPLASLAQPRSRPPSPHSGKASPGDNQDTEMDEPEGTNKTEDSTDREEGEEDDDPTQAADKMDIT
ncbi:Tho complex subunit 7-domain-containing protein [Cryomyces antarcticus]|nr:hypothetical protein LTR39_003025 [Cryomyces antarcticus]KAK5015231.1 hypothetical protein LTR60_002974 [Cryomyces antarcticus]KAK5163982.1 hypothetical protein LTR04_002158 [Oleoguttula sp. CCFEE 6159]